MGIRQAVLPWRLIEDLTSSGREFRISLARYFEVPLDAWMGILFDERRQVWYLRLSHPSWPENGVNPREEQWDYGLEHAHLMDLECRVPLTDFACEHGRGLRGGG